MSSRALPLSRLAGVAGLLVAALLVGCPEPPPPQGAGPKLANPQQQGDPPPPGGGTDAPAPQQPQPPAGGAEPASTTPWEVIPAATVEAIYPMLQGAKTWPAPAALQPIESLPQEKRPDPAKVRALEELVAYVVHPDLRPRDMKAAVGVDAEGRTFMRLGKDRAVGTASVDLRRKADDPKFDFPVFAISIDDPAAGDQTLERLARRVKAVVAGGLADELGKETHGLEAQPNVGGKDGVAAMAILDRNGFGGQFAYLYAWGTGKHLLVVLQEVPHMSLEGR